eukprot:8200520-Alexandrium_andersonii.AAC.1
MFELASADFPHLCQRLQTLAEKVLQCDKLHHHICARSAYGPPSALLRRPRDEALPSSSRGCS